MKLRIDQLAEHLKTNLAPIYVVAGEEIVLVQEACDVIKRAAHQKGFQEHISFSGDTSFDQERFESLTQSFSIFSEKTMMTITAPEKLAEKAKKAIEAYAKSPTSDFLIIIRVEKNDAALEKLGVLIPIWNLKLAEIPAWLQRRAQQQGMQLSKEAAAYLANSTEGNLLSAIQVLEQIWVWKGEGTIQLSDVQDSTFDTARFNAFDAVNALLLGDKAKLIRILDRLKQEGTLLIMILGAILREIRLIYSLQYQLKCGESFEALAQKHRLWDPRKKIILASTKRFLPEKLSEFVMKSFEIDAMTKGGTSGDPWIALKDACISL